MTVAMKATAAPSPRRPSPSVRSLAAMLREAAASLESMEAERELQDATIEMLERENARLHALIQQHGARPRRAVNA